MINTNYEYMNIDMFKIGFELLGIFPLSTSSATRQRVLPVNGFSCPWTLKSDSLRVPIAICALTGWQQYETIRPSL